jgi:hypothetical protein
MTRPIRVGSATAMLAARLATAPVGRAQLQLVGRFLLQPRQPDLLEASRLGGRPDQRLNEGQRTHGPGSVDRHSMGRADAARARASQHGAARPPCSGRQRGGRYAEMAHRYPGSRDRGCKGHRGSRAHTLRDSRLVTQRSGLNSLRPPGSGPDTVTALMGTMWKIDPGGGFTSQTVWPHRMSSSHRARPSAASGRGLLGRYAGHTGCAFPGDP